MLLEILYQLDWSQVILAIMTASAVFLRKRIKSLYVFFKEAFEGMRSVTDLRSDVVTVKNMVCPVDGITIVDRITQTQRAVAVLTEQVDTIAHTMRAEHDMDTESARFECNASGENTFVSQPYARMLGVGRAELLKWGFFNFIHPDDITKVRVEWERCRAEHRQFRMRFRMISAENTVLWVDVLISPVPEAPPVKRWVGIVRRVEDGAAKTQKHPSMG